MSDRTIRMLNLVKSANNYTRSIDSRVFQTSPATTNGNGQLEKLSDDPDINQNQVICDDVVHARNEVHENEDIPHVREETNKEDANQSTEQNQLLQKMARARRTAIQEESLEHEFARPFHITAEVHHRTPDPDQEFNNEFSDFSSDDDVADPTFTAPENENSEGESEEEDPATVEDETRKGRKRVSNPTKWKKNVKKIKKHSGLEYQTKNNKTIQAKVMKPPCTDSCKLKCKSRISDEKRQSIYQAFWNSHKSLETRRQYIASHVDQIEVKRMRERSGERHGQRKHMHKYSFEVDGKRLVVCKKFFLTTLSISYQTVDTAIKKKREGGIITPDKRGKHPPANKIPEEVRNGVRNHILKFPAYESHYSREKTKRKYLGNHLNISRMHNLYLEECQENGLSEENTAKEWLYAEIFNYEFNYAFKSPDNDTCDVCDQFKIQLQEAPEDTRQSVQENYEQHLRDASNRYKIKSSDKIRSMSDNSEKVVMIDLQKCLPTPDLHNSQSFYSLKLWTYNLTIHDATAKKAYCMMWDESVSGRGGNEVASCMIKWIGTQVDDTLQELTLWSDNCPSQNRNIMMVMCYFWMLNATPNLRVVNHKFLARGHTHLEADADHSIIERERKKIPQFKIITPWDWQQMVRMAGAKNKLNVIDMEVLDFKDLKKLYDGPHAPFLAKKKCEDGSDFLISNAVHLQVRQENPGILFFKTDFEQDAFLSVDMNRKTRRAIPSSIPPVREGPKPISTKKFKHLQKLLQWVPSRFHDFYKTLVHENMQED